jgi:hypothetical protein
MRRKLSVGRPVSRPLERPAIDGRILLKWM